MITGFETETCPLTGAEMALVIPCVDLLKPALGEHNAITADELAESLGVKPPRVRKIIHYIRTNGLLVGLVAKSRGYYITNDISVLMKYERSLAERINAIEIVRKTVARQINQLLYEDEWSREKNLIES